MIKFEIEEISNGYLVKGDLDWYEDANGDYVDDFVIYAANLPDAFATIATKCDNLMDDQIAKAEKAAIQEDITEELPF
jgi:hypothetical protein